MPTPGKFVRGVAKALGEPEPTVIVHDRNLVMAGLRSKDKRGRGAAQVTSRDAAHLLTAILASALVKDSVASVKRYTKTRVHRSTSTTGGYAKSGIEELMQLPAQHSFIDALEALIEGSAAGDNDTPLPGVLEVGALSPGTLGEIYLAGLPDKSTIRMRYTEPTPWDLAEKKPTSREVSAWESKIKKRGPRTLVEQFRRVPAEAIYGIASALNPNPGKGET